MFDYTGHALNEIMLNSWSQCHISSKSITYSDVVFQVNSDHEKAPKAAKAYFWHERQHIDEKLE